MDDMIRDASNQHHPTYDDQAWNKMEQLLDKHLPQKDDKRKYLLFFLLFLSVGAGLFFVFNRTKKDSSLQTEISSTVQSKTQTTSTAISPVLNNKEHQDIALASKTENTKQLSFQTNKKESGIQSIAVINKKENVEKPNRIKFSTPSKFRSHVTNSDMAENSSVQKDENNLSSATTSEPINNKSINDNINTAKDNATKTITSIKPVVITNKDTASNRAKTTTVSVSKQEKKKRNTIGNNFAFTISAGPGFSYVGLDNTGKTTISYGAGIKYNFAKRFSLRTGFYVTKKIYSADPSDYHPPKDFWTYYPNLQKIDADCKVYEIPLNISYNFGQSKKHNWFVSMGLSSYLMKQEEYDYYSKDVNGQTSLTNSATINNENKNVFSIVTLSGGYQYKINNRFSVAAEPYVELPINGIGFGNIKLNSGGLLITAIIKPFAGNK